MVHAALAPKRRRCSFSGGSACRSGDGPVFKTGDFARAWVWRIQLHFVSATTSAASFGPRRVRTLTELLDDVRYMKLCAESRLFEPSGYGAGR